MPRQDCQKVPEKVCKPETRVKVVEETEEVCEEEEVTTPKTTTTTTTRAPVTKAAVKPGKRYTYMYLTTNSDQKILNLKTKQKNQLYPLIRQQLPPPTARHIQRGGPEKREKPERSEKKSKEAEERKARARKE